MLLCTSTIGWRHFYRFVNPLTRITLELCQYVFGVNFSDQYFLSKTVRSWKSFKFFSHLSLSSPEILYSKNPLKSAIKSQTRPDDFLRSICSKLVGDIRCAFSFTFMILVHFLVRITIHTGLYWSSSK